MLKLYRHQIKLQRQYRFGREKPKPAAAPTLAEIEIGKLGASNRLDLDGIRKKIDDEVFNPYDQLGLSPTAPLAEIQAKLKVRRRLVQGQLNGQETNDNLPVEYRQELTDQLAQLDQALVIFASPHSRRQFREHYELEVARIIEANLTLSQKMSIKLSKTKDYSLELVKAKVPASIRTTYNFNLASIKQAKTQLKLKLNTPHKKYAFFSLFSLIFPFYLIIIPCHLVEEGVWERTCQEHHIMPVAWVVYAWRAFTTIYGSIALEVYNYVSGQRNVQIYEHSAVNEYETRNTELHELAVRLERLKK